MQLDHEDSAFTKEYVLTRKLEGVVGEWADKLKLATDTGEKAGVSQAARCAEIENDVRLSDHGRTEALRNTVPKVAADLAPMKKIADDAQREADRLKDWLKQVPASPVAPELTRAQEAEIRTHLRSLPMEERLDFVWKAAADADAQVLRVLMTAPASMPIVPREQLDEIVELYAATVHPDVFSRFQQARAVANSLNADMKALLKRMPGVSQPVG